MSNKEMQERQAVIPLGRRGYEPFAFTGLDGSESVAGFRVNPLKYGWEIGAIWCLCLLPSP